MKNKYRYLKCGEYLYFITSHLCLRLTAFSNNVTVCFAFVLLCFRHLSRVQRAAHSNYLGEKSDRNTDRNSGQNDKYNQNNADGNPRVSVGTHLLLVSDCFLVPRE